MTTHDHPAMARYRAQLARELRRVGEEERRLILAEIDNHVAEAIAAGRDVTGLLASFGSARMLARAYELELALNHRGRWLDRAFRIIGVLATATLPSIIIVSVLGAVSVALTGAGLFGFFAALLSPLLPPGLLPPDFKVQLAILTGLPLAAAGVCCLVLLWIYLRFLLGIVLQVMHDRQIEFETSMMPRWLLRMGTRLRASRTA